MNSYSSVVSPWVTPYKDFHEDFKDAGDFKEEKVEKNGTLVISLEAKICIGEYDGEKWNKKGNSDDKGYVMHLTYHSKNQVEVFLEALFAEMEESFKFMERAARKFFLVNEYLRKHPAYAETEWTGVKDFIQERKLSTIPSDGQSWYKTMPLEDVQKLFKYLKVRIVFPSGYSFKKS